MTLDHQWNIRANLLAYEGAAIANHNLERVDDGGVQGEKLGDLGLNEVLGTAAVDKDRNLVVVNRAIHVEGCLGRHA